MPRSTAYFQAQAADAASAASPSAPTSRVAYADGKLTISPGDAIHQDEIVLIAPQPAGAGGYVVVGLHEAPTEPGHAAPAQPFRLTTRPLAPADLQLLPPDLVERVLLPDGRNLSFSSSPLHVVVSTRSGLGQAQAFYDAVLQPLLQLFGLSPGETAHSTYHLLVTTSPRSIAELAAALPPGPATVVLLSGDGGVVDLLNGVTIDRHDDRPTIALLPLGTGNALFHSLHKPQYAASPGPSPLVHGLRTLVRGRPAPLPNFVATFAPGSHLVALGGDATTPVASLRGAIVASYGFHAQLVWESDTPAYRRHGDKRFGMAAAELLKTSHAYEADVAMTPSAPSAAEAVRLRHPFNYVLASMVSNLERAFTISPASQPLDGQLRLVHFGAVGSAKTMDIMMAAYNNGTHVGMRWTTDDNTQDSVGYDAIDALQVTVNEKDARWRKVCIDGTIVELPKGGWMRVQKDDRPVLQILV